jgi:hypothetical protein
MTLFYDVYEQMNAERRHRTYHRIGMNQILLDAPASILSLYLRAPVYDFTHTF